MRVKIFIICIKIGSITLNKKKIDINLLNKIKEELMDTVNKIAKNTSILFSATLISYLFGFFTTLYAARYLGAEEFGVISLALALTGIYIIFTDLGLNTLIVREISRDKTLVDSYVTNITLIKLMLVVITFGLLILTIKILGYSQQVTYVVILITFSMIFTSFSGLFNSIFQAYEKMEYQSIGTILNAALILLGVLIAIYYNLSVITFAFVYVIASFIVLIYSFMVYSWKFALPKIIIDLSFWKPTIKEALPYGITGIFATVYLWIDSIILSVMVGNEVVGWYNAAYRLVFIFLSLYAVYMISIFPVMSGFYKSSKKSIKIVYERSFKYLLIVSFPLAVFITLMANKIILFIYGTGYIPSIITLQILIWTIVFMFINNLSYYLLGSINKPLIGVKIFAFGAILNIILNLLLIPKFSYIGSAYATVITEISMLPIFLHILLKTEYAEIKPLTNDLPRILLSNIVLTVVIIYLTYLNIFLIILIGVSVYIVMILITQTLDSEDIFLIKSLLKRNRRN